MLETYTRKNLTLQRVKLIFKGIYYYFKEKLEELTDFLFEKGRRY